MMSRDGVGLLFPRSPGTVGSEAVHTLDGPYVSEQVLDFADFFDDVMYQAEITGVLPFEIRHDADIATAIFEGCTIAIIDGGPTCISSRPGPVAGLSTVSSCRQKGRLVVPGSGSRLRWRY